MEFLDEESRPKLLFQSRTISTNPEETNPNTPLFSLQNPTLFISLPLSLLLFFLSLFHFQSEPLQSIFFWLALSFFVGPFAPSIITAGDIRVGLGPILPPPPEIELPSSDSLDVSRKASRRSRIKKVEEPQQDFSFSVVSKEEKKKEGFLSNGVVGVKEESEWTDGDLEILKKQMAKNPVGMPGRWAVISEVFNGRHCVESVIKTAKSLGERKVSDSDSFDRFLKNRKPVDKRVEEEIANAGFGSNGEVSNEKEKSWSSGEDIALLNALKAFPKDVAMRWEKITAAVPGKTKAACMSRVAELKRDFRISKAEK
ncbi:transcription factor MAMYB [Apium graveolens]|uniref:transcription factor MAMYB n=1 Tax=Apium graveolens TaxID=4045 RepID=UPI003D78E063